MAPEVLSGQATEQLSRAVGRAAQNDSHLDIRLSRVLEAVGARRPSVDFAFMPSRWSTWRQKSPAFHRPGSSSSLQSPPRVFAGTILVAPFVDVPTLVPTYRIASSIPILSPLARFLLLFNYLSIFTKDKWLSKDRIAEHTRPNQANGEKYQLTLIYAKDHYDVPSHHRSGLLVHR